MFTVYCDRSLISHALKVGHLSPGLYNSRSFLISFKSILAEVLEIIPSNKKEIESFSITNYCWTSRSLNLNLFNKVETTKEFLEKEMSECYNGNTLVQNNPSTSNTQDLSVVEFALLVELVKKLGRLKVLLLLTRIKNS